MRSESLTCWRCGSSLAAVLLPIGRLAECPECRADLHVCRLCRFYDRRMIGQCTHDTAERVEVKERSNFCGHFRPRPRAHEAGTYAGDEDAKRALDALFRTPVEPVTDQPPLPPPPAPASPDPEQARRELEALFGLPSDGREPGEGGSKDG